MDAVIASAVSQNTTGSSLYILKDKDQAAYFQNDLQNLLETEVLLYPTSYKKPYQYQEIENANVLMRAEIINRILEAGQSQVHIVTYPEALCEKVINKQSLVANTMNLQVGSHMELNALNDQLQEYGFERTDFVYEAGQFSIRGGIVDIYSYANQLPFRIEFLGSEVESIRTFDPINQLSVDQLQKISIIPNVETRLINETRQSFFEFLFPDTKIWIKDPGHLLEICADNFQHATKIFGEKLTASRGTTVISEPAALFETAESTNEQICRFNRVHFDQHPKEVTDQTINFEADSQPTFNKNFDLICERLRDYYDQGYECILIADSESQLDRLKSIFRELDPDLVLKELATSLRGGFIDHQLRVLCFTDHQLFDRFHKFKTRQRYTKSRALTLKELRTLAVGDFVAHVDYGIGRFAGMEKVAVGDKEQEALRLVYKDDDLLYLSIHSLHKISKYSGKEGVVPMVNKLGSQEWEQKKKRAKSKVKEIARDLIELYAKRKNAPGYAFDADGFLQAELESSFFYEDTPDQAKATEDVKQDMMAAHPMDRLICGDVGFGKTEVAVRAAFKCVVNGKQAAVLVPTTILAMQHFNTFSDRLSDFPVEIEYINRFKTSKEIKATLQRTAEGKTNILIGTHRMVSKDVAFKDLGLLVVDEEQKFGVTVKERLKELKVNVDTLTLTATPIPRTLHFSLMGARDLSIISTPPPNRQPVTTEIHTFNDVLIRDAISYELKRGGQVFFVHNRIANIEEVGNIVRRLVPDARLAIAHGQMDGPRLEKVMVEFINGTFDILVSTNIIESGLDIPNANTIIINQAQMFGLSDLHQMRGRVGRSNRKAFCYLLTPPAAQLSADARKRLSTLEEFSELGAGIKVALRDLDIRGAGNLLGKEQSGFITDLGFEMYHKILDEAVNELKEDEFKDLFKTELPKLEIVKARDCNIETDLELLIPDHYVSSVSERLQLYSRLDNLSDESEITQFIKTMVDRFGPIPKEVLDLVETVRLRWIAQNLGCEKLVLKNATIKCHLLRSDNETYYKSEVFGKILGFVSSHPQRCHLKETKNRLLLVIKHVDGIKEAKELLGLINKPEINVAPAQ
ncbi:MAG: transcription-repair-coupling factor [Cyclobacteriaceae bacterium]|nr:MAG: transcription-repair-coupling factor [Cyclobacteriaceae bacterium]